MISPDEYGSRTMLEAGRQMMNRDSLKIVDHGGESFSSAGERRIELEKRESVITESDDAVIKDWRKLFNAAPDQNMRFFPPEVSNGKMVVSPPNEVFEEGELCWKNALVAQFVGKMPNFSYFQKMVNVLWGADREVDVRSAGYNLFIIQFPNSSTRDRVLETGPWHIQNKPLIVRKWEAGMKSLDFTMARLPVWIQLGNVPLELFTNNGLSYISSAIGKPLYMDRVTASQKRLAYAKICVEVEATTEISSFIDVKLRNGTMTSVTVEVPWLPPKCLQCNIFGHNEKSCPKQQVGSAPKVWKPKKTVEISEEVKEIPKVEGGNDSVDENLREAEGQMDLSLLVKR